MSARLAETLRRIKLQLMRAAWAWRRLHGQQIVHVLHVRKSGGTAVKAALQQIVRTSPPEAARLVFHAHWISASVLPRGDRIVLFLRDPVTRFVSGFRSRQRQGRPRYLQPWSDGERRAFARFLHANDLAEALWCDDLETEAEARRAMHWISHLRMGLVYWTGKQHVVEHGSEDLWFIGRQEFLDHDFRSLCKQLGLPPQRLPEDDYAAHRSPDDRKGTGLSNAGAANVRRWYEEDYQVARWLVQNRGVEIPWANDLLE